MRVRAVGNWKNNAAVSRRRVKSCLNVASFCFLDIACRSVELDRCNGDFSHRFRSDN